MKTTKTNSPDKIVMLLQQAIALHNEQRLDEADEIYKKKSASYGRPAMLA